MRDKDYSGAPQVPLAAVQEHAPSIAFLQAVGFARDAGDSLVLPDAAAARLEGAAGVLAQCGVRQSCQAAENTLSTFLNDFTI